MISITQIGSGDDAWGPKDDAISRVPATNEEDGWIKTIPTIY